MRPRAFRAWIGVLLLLATSACEVVDRARGRGTAADTAAAAGDAADALVLRLQTPGMLRPGEEGTVRVSVTNRGQVAVGGAHLELFVPGWLEPGAPLPGGREVTLTSSDEEGLRFSYRLGDPPIAPGNTETVEQRVRIPAASPAMQGAQPWGRTVRARLTGPDGRSMAEVESELAVDTLALADSARAAGDTAAAAPRDRLGPVRLGMPAAALRQTSSGARDTAWSSAEGTGERGMVVPLPGGGRALALLAGDSVGRIEVRDSVVRTREGLGVGSRFSELRSAFGRPCADVAEGAVVVWFPRAPGVSFALDVPTPRDPGLARREPERIPGTARVTRWWIRRGSDRC